MDMKKKMSNRDKMILFILAAVALLAIVWFFVVSKLNSQKAELVAENATLEQEVSRLKTMAAQEESVLEETKNYKLSIADTLSKFPSEVNTEDAIYDLNQMYESISDVKIDSESFNMNQIFYKAGMTDASGAMTTGTASLPMATQNASVSAITADTPVSEVVSAAVDYTGYRSDISVTFTAPYRSVKKVVDFVNESKNRMTIRNLTMTSEDKSESNALSCTMNIAMYAVSGTGKIYESPNVSESGVGVDNIFRKN